MVGAAILAVLSCNVDLIVTCALNHNRNISTQSGNDQSKNKDMATVFSHSEMAVGTILNSHISHF